MKFTKLFAALMVAALIGIAGCDETGGSPGSEGAPEFEGGGTEMEDDGPADPGPEAEAEAAAEPAAEPEAEPEAEAEG